ncbi:PP2C family protein-serine/threonine phosphatase [Nocardioides sp. AX2bis]|uniref:PP2C family protein-serine/threonine phosphatase n=1 Tax=Nocardioides sp. AX2bis TaxID=2653157 RepID=UPI0012F3F495|nr:SpoIIE family protein phosphatase [Nocardioides sp. AX2bis]VXB48170.1 GAF domain-containing protein [Nocardioides sp. AX2bis]
MPATSQPLTPHAEQWPAPPGPRATVHPLVTPSARALRAVEDQRQRALDSLALEDDGQQERFDRITRIACRSLSMPMAYITVLDRDRAWWPSATGFPPGVPADMPREETLCNTTQGLGETLVIEDAREDPRFADFPIVTGGLLVSYAGVPLRDSMGHVLGSLCVSDTEPRHLDPDDLDTLSDLARWAEQELTASSEMRQARQVQNSMLPVLPVSTEEWEVAGMCLPALAVGGDFYDYTVTDDVLHVMLGDVMGKGTGAALVGAGIRAALRGTTPAVVAGVDLGVTTTQVARSVNTDLERAESFVTLVQAAVDLEDGTARYVDGGAGLGLVAHHDGTCTRLSSLDRPIGVLPDDHWTEHELDLLPGDRMVLFSDGLLDLLDDPMAWWEAVEAMVREADDVSDLLGSVGLLARRRTPLDDVTAVGVFRTPVFRGPRPVRLDGGA